MWLSFQVLVPLMVGSGLNNGATAACTLIFSKKQSKEEIKRETTTWKSPKKKKEKSCPNLSKCIDILQANNNKKSITSLVPEILYFHYCWKIHLKSTWSWWCMLFTLLKNILYKEGERLEMICTALINLYELSFDRLY